MIIDMHAHAGRPRRTGDVDRVVLGACHPETVAALRASGLNLKEIGKVCSGNWPRMPRAVRA